MENKKSEEVDTPAVKMIQKEDEKLEVPRKARKPAVDTNGADGVVADIEEKARAPAGNKRKREVEDDGAEGAPAKKAKGGMDDSPIVVDDDHGEGAIVLD